MKEVTQLRKEGTPAQWTSVPNWGLSSPAHEKSTWLQDCGVTQMPPTPGQG
jgi:hypothetical protein